MSALLFHGANIEAQDSNGCTAAHKAAANGHLACLKLLLAAGAKPDAASPVGNTPLHLVRAAPGALFVPFRPGSTSQGLK